MNISIYKLQPKDLQIFTSAVIDAAAFQRIKEYIEHARSSSDIDVLAGGKCDDSIGYFVEPTILVTKNPHEKLMEEVSVPQCVTWMSCLVT